MAGTSTKSAAPARRVLATATVPSSSPGMNGFSPRSFPSPPAMTPNWQGGVPKRASSFAHSRPNSRPVLPVTAEARAPSARAAATTDPWLGGASITKRRMRLSGGRPSARWAWSCR